MRAGPIIAALIVSVGAVGWAITRPEMLSEADLAGIEPDLARGEIVFHAAGCASCHAADGAKGEARLVLTGGHKFDTPAGVFYAPNISQDPTHGIGGWNRAQVATAILKGTSPDGRHYYPAFPYGSYAHADLADVMSLAAYLETLPADPTPSRPHELGFPYSIRTGIGLWKVLNIAPGPIVAVSDEPEIRRGQYLVEVLGHCGECHTPRTLTQGLDRSRWLAGAPNPSGKGGIPNITPAKLDWSREDIVAYLETGFRPDFDVVGGSMVSVVTSLAELPETDRRAIAAYLKAAPAIE